MWDTIDLLPFISWIAQSVDVDDLMIGIGQKWKINCSLTVRGDLCGEVLAHIRGINADRVELYVLILL